MSERTFRVTRPHMEGDDVRGFQSDLRRKLAHWGVPEYPLTIDGSYGVATRAAAADVARGLGIAQADLARGITPAMRSKMRHSRLTPVERARYVARAGWRRALVARHAGGGTAAILARIDTHANGFQPGHDGVDLICSRRSPAFAMVRSRVVRISDEWWRLGAPSDPKVRDLGDGIVILRSLVDIGPIRNGDLFGYGHGEHPVVSLGDIVSAGQHVCDAGFANASHLHLMWFRGNPGVAKDGGPKGIGNRDPWPAVKFCMEHAA